MTFGQQALEFFRHYPIPLIFAGFVIVKIVTTIYGDMAERGREAKTVTARLRLVLYWPCTAGSGGCPRPGRKHRLQQPE